MICAAVEDDSVSSRRRVDDPGVLERQDRCYEELQSGGSGVAHGPLVRRHLPASLYQDLRLLQTRADHILLDVFWPASRRLPWDSSPFPPYTEDQMEDAVYRNGGVVVPDFESYVLFADLLLPLAKELHGVSELHTHPESKLVDERQSLDEIAAVDVDPSSKWGKMSVAECCRNLDRYTLPVGMGLAQLDAAEKDLVHALEQCFSDGEDDGDGVYIPLRDVLASETEVRQNLHNKGLLVPLPPAGGGQLVNGPHWPHGRGVFVSGDGDAVAWINVQDHLRLVVRAPGGRVGSCYARVARVLARLDTLEDIAFRREPNLGFLSSRPAALGGGVHLRLSAYLPRLGADDANLRRLCAVRGLEVQALGPEKAFVLVNRRCLGVCEVTAFNDFATAATNIVQLEYTAGTAAGIFGNIFKKK